MLLATDDRPAFERVPGEPVRAYHGFCHYRDLGPMRSLDVAWRQHHERCLHQIQPVTKRRPMSWGNWSARWGWVERAAFYDAYLERQKRAALEAEQAEASRRHARALQAGLSALLVPLRVALETAAAPSGIEVLRAAAASGIAGLRAALSDARLSAAHLPALVQAERLVLGMSTDYHEVTDPPAVDPIAARIVTDPAALDAAIKLLDLIARPATAEGSAQ